MISHAFSRDQEAWIGWADEQEKTGMSCRVPNAAPGVKNPPFLHFCQNIKVRARQKKTKKRRKADHYVTESGK